MKLDVNFIASAGRYFESGTEVPNHLVPPKIVQQHRIGDIQASEICRRREELRQEARERREKTEAKRAGKQSARNL